MTVGECTKLAKTTCIVFQVFGGVTAARDMRFVHEDDTVHETENHLLFDRAPCPLLLFNNNNNNNLILFSRTYSLV